MKKLFIIILMVLITACKKDKNTLSNILPPITEEGSNTFGCLIEDEVYVPVIRRISWSIPGPQVEPIEFIFPQYPDYFFRVSTVRIVSKSDELMDAEVKFMVDSCVIKPGIYRFSHVSVYYKNDVYTSYSIDNDSLVITKIDTINNIISGQFNANLTDVATYSKTLHITNGRFDLKK